MASLTLDNGILVYRTPYNHGLVAALKAAVPASDRKWDLSRKVWLVAPKHGLLLASITEQYLGEVLQVPTGASTAAQPETRVLDVRYIGMTKNRGDGSRTAFGWIGDEWAVIFPEEVLKGWFNVKTRPDEEQTLYGALGLKQSPTPLEIKKAYRRLSLQWHPDRCHEPDAHKQFIKIKHAYDILADPNTRARYNAGLALASTMGNEHYSDNPLFGGCAYPNGYRSPLRCGLIMATGTEIFGRFVVSEILAWEDLTDALGHVLVTSWPVGADTFEETWV